MTLDKYYHREAKGKWIASSIFWNERDLDLVMIKFVNLGEGPVDCWAIDFLDHNLWVHKNNNAFSLNINLSNLRALWRMMEE